MAQGLDSRPQAQEPDIRLAKEPDRPRAQEPDIRLAKEPDRPRAQEPDIRPAKEPGERAGQAAGERAGQAAGERTGQTTGTRPGQTASARSGQTAGTRAGQAGGSHSQAGSSQRSSQRPPSRTGQMPSSSRSRRRPKKKGFDPYDLIKPGLILLVIIIFVVAIVFFIKRKDTEPKPTEPTTSESVATVAPEAITEASPTEPPTEPAPVVYKTTANPRLNVRSEPSTSGSLLGTLAVGTVVDYVQAYNDEWAIIMFEGTQAYVSSQYLEAQEAAPGAASETVPESESSAAESSTAAQ